MNHGQISFRSVASAESIGIIRIKNKKVKDVYMHIGKFLTVILISVFLLTVYAFSAQETMSLNELVSFAEPTIVHEYDNLYSIRGFDVNENGDIVISVKEKGDNFLKDIFGKVNYAIYVYDNKMTLKYGIKFKGVDGSIGAMWKNGYPTAVMGYNDAFVMSFDDKGNIVSYEDIERKSNKAFEKERTVNGQTYIITNSKDAVVPKFISPSDEYKYLFLKDSGEIKVLYECTAKASSHEHRFVMVILVVLVIIVLLVGSLYFVWFKFIRKRIRQ